MRKNYKRLKKQYPEYISKVQLYKICNISPRSASYLLNNGIIPSINTGKETWRYKIKIDDVIDYLEKREKVGSMIPPGSVSSRYKHPANQRKSFADLIGTGDKQEIVKYFSYIYADYPDVLTAGEVAEMTGFGKSTIFKLVKKGLIKTIPCPTAHRYLIPKAYLLDYLQTPSFIESKSNSEMFKKILGGFEVWKSAK